MYISTNQAISFHPCTLLYRFHWLCLANNGLNEDHLPTCKYMGIRLFIMLDMYSDLLQCYTLA